MYNIISIFCIPIILNVPITNVPITNVPITNVPIKCTY